MNGIIALSMFVLSWIFQLLGVIIVFGSNASFFLKARRGKYHSLKKEFVMKVEIQILPTEEEILKADANEELEKYRFAKWLYATYRDTMIGAIFTLVGVILGTVVVFTPI